jgi:hypothetical protein
MTNQQQTIYLWAVIIVQSFLAIASIVALGIMYLRGQVIPPELQTLGAMIIAFYFGKNVHPPTDGGTTLITQSKGEVSK